MGITAILGGAMQVIFQLCVLFARLVVFPLLYLWFQLAIFLYLTYPLRFWSRAWVANRSAVWWSFSLAPGAFALGASVLKRVADWLPELWLFAPVHLLRDLVLIFEQVVAQLWAYPYRWLRDNVPLRFGGLVAFLLLSAAWLYLLSPIYLLLVVLKMANFRPREVLRVKRPAFFDSHGSARFGRPAEAARSGDAPASRSAGTDLVMSRLARRWGWARDYRVRGHVLTRAPTGAGKGVGCVLPNLLAYPGSVFCLDVKGENYRFTAERRRQLGQEVALFDPFGVTGAPSVAVDWLETLDTAYEGCIAAAAVADALVERNPRDESHWDDAAGNLLQGLLLYTASTGGHVGQVRAWLVQTEAELAGMLGALAEGDEIAFGVPARVARSFLAKADRERSGVLSTAQRHTAFLDDPRVTRALGADPARPKFSLDRLKAGAASFYLVISPDEMATYHRLARVTLGLALKAMLRGEGVPEHDVLFLLDEFAQLGYFPPVGEALAILRGYGGALWVLVQDLGQLKETYPKWRSFLANAHLQFFGTQDLETAQHVSQLLGNKTVQVTTTNAGGSLGGGADGVYAGRTETFTQRPLRTPEEVRLLGAEKVLMFERGKVPFLLERLDVRTQAAGWRVPWAGWRGRRATAAPADAPEVAAS